MQPWIRLINVVSINFINLAGLFLSIQGTAIDNDSFVDLDDIGSSEGFRLLCLTNDTNCCSGAQGMVSGAWFFPDGTALPTVPSLGINTGFARDRAQSVVRLYRINTPPERGRFRCDLLGDTIYVNICE